MICGDFNCPDIPWTSIGIDLFDSLLVRWASDNFLSQHILTPTCPTSQAILDLLFTDVSTHIEKLSVNERFGSSDRSVISFNVSLPVDYSSPSTQSVPNFSKANWKLFRRLLLNSHWPHNPEHSNVNATWERYLLNNAAKRAIPLKLKSPWTPLHKSKVRKALRSYRRNVC